MARGPSDEGCATSHRLILDPLPANDIDRIAHDVRAERKGEKEGWKRGGERDFEFSTCCP